MRKLDTLNKDALRLIRSSKSRFFSLTAIVTIGVAFFVGVSSSSYIMARNVDAYSDTTHLKDITVYSSYGFDEEDLNALRTVEGVERVEGSRFVDVIAASNSTTKVTRVHAYDPSNEINGFVLMEGRYPENDHEVLGEKGSDLIPGFPLGTKIRISRPDGDLSDWLNVEEVTVVGTVDTPLYLNQTKENSTLSNRNIETFFYIPISAFCNDFDTEVNILTKDSASMNSFTSAYLDANQTIADAIEKLGHTQALHRRDVVVAEANEKYEDGLKEYNDAKKEFDDGIAEAREELEDAAEKIANGQKELDDAVVALRDAERELQQTQIDKENEIHAARREIEKGQSALEESRKTFEEKKAEALTQRAQIQQFLDFLNTPLYTPDSKLNDLKDSGYFPKDDEELNAFLEQYGDYTVEEGVASLEKTIDALNKLPDETKDKKINELLFASDKMEPIIEDLNKLNPEMKLKDVKNSDASEETKLFIEGYIAVVDGAGEMTVGQFLEAYDALRSLKDLYGDMSVNEVIDKLNRMKELLVEGYEGVPDSISLQELRAMLEKIDTEQGTSYAVELDELMGQFGLTSDSTVADLKLVLQSTISTIDSSLLDAERQLEEGQAQLDKAYEMTVNGAVQLYEGIEEGKEKIRDGWKEIEENQRKLEDARIEYEDGLKEFEDQRLDGEEKLNEAKADLDTAKQKIEDLQEAEWTVLTRKQHYGSATYQNSVDQMKAIANIFPMFFFLVAALVCLTTMTRMIAEQRGQIGIMRALGYTPLQCARKYLTYALIATLIGDVLGTFIGLAIFPLIIYNAWKMMFVEPMMKLYIPWSTVFLATFGFLVVMLFTTWKTASSDMNEVPAQLLRPKAPKIGRATVLERIPWLWSRLSFFWKVTIRNLLRDKKRMAMTVFGVAGCTALLITGFGIKGSVNTIVQVQFGEILKYDGTVSAAKDLSASEIRALFTEIAQMDSVEKTVVAGGYTALAKNGDKEETVNAQVFATSADLEEMVSVRTRVGQKPLHLSEDGVLVTERLTERLGLKVGDTFVLESESGLKKEVKIVGISEMYAQHYVYMSEAYYEKIFGTSCPMKVLLVKSHEGSDVLALQETLTSDARVESITFYDKILDQFSSMVKSLDMIVWVLIISSMSLMFVVLGNLTNINISERQREIATFKVLGFRKREIEKYIYIENNVLTLFGALAGIPLGIVLHHWIMGQVEMEHVMFGRNVELTGILISVFITCLYGRLVNQFMKKRLAAVEMVESLKSVE